jgi:hypothetical protein
MYTNFIVVKLAANQVVVGKANTGLQRQPVIEFTPDN